MDQHTQYDVQGHLQMQQPQDAVLAQSRMQESLKRSVTLVFWYKAGTDPLRLHQEIPTFPLFQLAHFTQLVKDLGLSPSTYVDAYDPHSATWEQQTISTVRVVESEQRLLYRFRQSLLEGFVDSDCPGIEHEIGLQSRITRPSHTLSLKRPLPDSEHSGPSPKQHRLDNYPSPPAGSTTSQQSTPSTSVSYPQNLSVPKPGGEIITFNQPAPNPQTSLSGQYQVAQTYPPASHSSASNAVPIHPHPPMKRWPNDYTVSEISAGFREMDAMIAQQPSLTQKVTFERVFGCRYIKSTVCRHRAVWKRADPSLKESYERMGQIERAVWGDFVKKVEGRGGAAPANIIHANASTGDHPQNLPQTQQPQPVQSPLQGQHISQSTPVPRSAPMSTPVPMGMVPQQLHHNTLVEGESAPAMGSLGPPPLHPVTNGLHAG
ncbi:hypothetical protein K474DRAFT_1664271 [Panus rudis PR-1116 ss-1]|nr:hypothetical protein K474DRAFT_1664271 [Panus rudis PR-1116 ss-1]